MTRILLVATLTASIGASAHAEVTRTMQIKKLTPILLVEQIEPVAPFWERLGFAREVEVPHEGKLGFVIFKREGIEVMYQTWASAAADAPEALDRGPGHSAALYLEVDDLQEITRRLEGFEVAVPQRETFYGATEIYYRDPGGTIIGFAVMSKPDQP